MNKIIIYLIVIIIGCINAQVVKPEDWKFCLKRFSNYTGEVNVNYQWIEFIDTGVSNEIFVSERKGKIYKMNKITGIIDINTPVLDVSSLTVDGTNYYFSASAGEEGLLGMAISPNYETDKRLFISITSFNGNQRMSWVLSYTVTYTNNLAVGANYQRSIIKTEQPAGNHNGGQILFGCDSLLYIMLGDGGGSNDKQNNAQNKRSMLGKILRVDVSNADNAYTIPPSNPFANNNNYLPEIFATGLRNPWRNSFDRSNGKLWAGDVGQNTLEEVDIIGSGGNYGWRLMEGSICTPSVSDNPCDENTAKEQDLQLPVIEYSRGSGGSVTGGFVYRGQEYSSLFGTYFYGDSTQRKYFASHKVDGKRTNYEITWDDSEGCLSYAGSPLSFGEDREGELYILSATHIYKFGIMGDTKRTEAPLGICTNGIDGKKVSPSFSDEYVTNSANPTGYLLVLFLMCIVQFI